MALLDAKPLVKYIGAEFKDNLKIKGALKIVKSFSAELMGDKKNIEM